MQTSDAGHGLIQVEQGEPQAKLKQGWVIGIYGIPIDANLLRRKLCAILRSHGMWSIDLGGCYDSETLAYTKRGLRKYNELELGDIVLSLNQKGEIEEDVITAVGAHEYSGQMFHFQQRSVDLLVTPNHRMLFRGISNPKTKNLRNGRWQDYVSTEEAESLSKRKKFAIPSGYWTGKKTESIAVGEKEYNAHLLCYLVGLYIGDGYSRRNLLRYVAETGLTHAERVATQRGANGRFLPLMITGKRPEPRHASTFQTSFYIPRGDKARDRAERTLLSLGVTYTTPKQMLQFTSESFVKFFHRFGQNAESKQITAEFLSLDTDCLKALFDGIIDSDGYRGKNYVTIDIISKNLAEGLIELGTKLGLGVTLHKRKRKGHFKNNGGWVRESQTYSVSFRKTEKGFYGGSRIDKIPYSGTVWCPQVERNHNLLVYRNGKTAFCGNSVYLGVHVPGLDEDVKKMVDELEHKTGRRDLVHIVLGDYGSDEVEFFRSQVLNNVLAELNKVEQNLDELDRALDGKVVLTDKKGLPRNLYSTGGARLRDARDSLKDAGRVAERFQLSGEYAQEATQIRAKIERAQKAVGRTDLLYKRWCVSTAATRRAVKNL